MEKEFYIWAGRIRYAPFCMRLSTAVQFGVPKPESIAGYTHWMIYLLLPGEADCRL